MLHWAAMEDNSMKKYSLLFIFVLFFVPFNISVYAGNTESAENELISEKHVFGVHGLSCPFCVIGVKKTFKKIDGVQSIEVSLKHSTVTILTSKGVCFSDEELKSIFGKAGFSYHGTISKPTGCK